MSSATSTIDNWASQEYKYGFVTDIEVDIVPPGLNEDVIGLIRRDPRMERVKVLILATDVDTAVDRFGATVDGVIQSPLAAQSLRDEVESALEAVEMGLRQRRVNEVAADASSALMLLAEANVNVSSALASSTAGAATAIMSA